MLRIFSCGGVALLLSFGLSAAVQAQEPQAMHAQASCAAPVAPTGELAAWTSPGALTASADAKRPTVLTVGQAATVTLSRTADVRYALRPEKPGGSVSYGGMLGIDVVQPATYRVALSSGAWIDLVKQGKAVTSVAHGHGPDCTGVRKMVDFPLTPGRYTLQLAANGEPQMTVLVARLP